MKFFINLCGLLLVVFILTVLLNPFSHAMVVFTDDFENGNLDNWIIGGRRLGTNIANVVPCNTGSLGAHLYHSSFTEIVLYRDFDFDPNGTFYFDLEVDVSSTPPPSPNYYGSSGLNFGFLDSSGSALGSVWYVAATTNYPFTNWPNPTTGVNQISENVMTHYAIDISDMLSQIAIDESQVTDIRMMMHTYSSTYPYPIVSSELWIDNISTVPIPGAAWLLLSGMIGLIGIRKKFSK